LEIHQSLTQKFVEQGVVNQLKTKDKNLRKVIHLMSSFAFIVVLAGILYGNYLMLIPHLNAISMASLLSLVLSSARDWMVNKARYIRRVLLQNKRLNLSVFNLQLPVMPALMLSTSLWFFLPSNILTGLFVACCALTAIVCFDDISPLVSCFLTVLVVCTIFVPLVLILHQFALEAEIIANYLMALIDSDESLQSMVDSILNSTVYITFRSHGISWLGDDIFPKEVNGTLLKDELRDLAARAGTNLQSLSGNIFHLLNNVGNVLWAFTTFSTTLFYLLSAKSPWELCDTLSPLSPEDNAEIYQSLKMSTVRIILCSSFIGLIHATTMYSILVWSGAPIAAFPACCCGFFAVIPLWGTYVVFLPIAGCLWAAGSQASACVLVVMELFLTLIVDAVSWLNRFILWLTP